MRCILSPTPLNLIDLLFYFEGLQVIEFRFVGLEFGMELVFAGFFLNHVSLLCQLMQSRAVSQGLAYCLIPLE